MKHLRTELFKVQHSGQALFGYGLVFLLIIVVVVGYKTKANFPVSGLDIPLVSLGNIIQTLSLHFIMALITGFLFAGEFVYQTYKYIMLRPVSLKALISSKLAAILIYCGEVILFIGGISLILGLASWGTGPVHGAGYNTVLDHGMMRMVIFYLGTWLNMIFIISLAIFCSVILKNQVSTVIATMGILFLLILITDIFPQVQTLSPVTYLSLKPLIFGTTILWADIVRSILVNWGLGMVLVYLSYINLRKKDILL